MNCVAWARAPLHNQSGHLPGDFHLIRKLAALIWLAVAFSGSFTLGTQSVEAKTLRNSSPPAKNYLVPPPPPYIPTMVPASLAMLEAQALAADAQYAVAEKRTRTSRNSSSRAGDYLVPPPPPYTPSIVLLSALSTSNGGAATADYAVKPVNSYSLTCNQGNMPQVGPPNPFNVSYFLGVEKKVQNEIDHFDSEILNHEKEIGKLLKL